MGGGLEGGTDTAVAEAMCAGCACRRLYEWHTANRMREYLHAVSHGILTDICSTRGLSLEGRHRHRRGRKRAKPWQVGVAELWVISRITRTGLNQYGLHPMSIFDLRVAALVIAALAVAHGTYFSLRHDTFLDTSDPLLTVQPHHLADTHHFASKRSPLNLIFLKWSWAWSTAAFLALLVPPRSLARRLLQWTLATAAWSACAVSFFGPGLLARLATASGAECGLHLGPASFVPIPASFCDAAVSVSRATHPHLFPLVLVLDPETDLDRPFVPRLRRGHDVSGHVFLLTLAVLFLADQLRQTRSATHIYARVAVGALLALWVFSLWVTSVYFHSPSEKISGFCTGLSPLSLTVRFHHLTFFFSLTVIGVACFVFSQMPLWFYTK